MRTDSDQRTTEKKNTCKVRVDNGQRNSCADLEFLVGLKVFSGTDNFPKECFPVQVRTMVSKVSIR